MCDISLAELNRLNKLTNEVIGAAIEVHKFLGPGLLESVYEACLVEELLQNGHKTASQVELPICYKDKLLSKNYRVDVLVDDSLIIELKSVEKLLPIHEAQLLSYLKMSGMKIGLLINFNVPVLKDGVKRRINGKIVSV